MSTQQINLFNPRFSNRKRLLSARTVLFVCLLALGSNLSVWLWFAYMNHEIEQQYVKMNAAQQTQMKEMKATAATLAADSSEATLRERLATLDAEVLQEQQRLDVLQEQLGSRIGYSQYMRALARQGLPNVWLNSLNLSGGGDLVQVRIQASARYPSLVPKYLKQLHRQPLLNGHAGPPLQLGSVDADHARYVRFELIANAQQAQP